MPGVGAPITHLQQLRLHRRDRFVLKSNVPCSGGDECFLEMTGDLHQSQVHLLLSHMYGVSPGEENI